MAFFSIEGDRLVAYDLVSGEQKWLVTARPSMQPSAGNGLLFLLEASTLKALRTSDGSIAWELPLVETLAVPPVWDNGWLVVSLTTGEFRAYRDIDGELIWKRDLKSPAHALPALAADRVYVPTTDHRIVALRIESGEPIWERKLTGAANDLLALDRRIFAGSDDNFFYCLLAEDGQVDWKWRTGGDVIGRPVADDRLVYFVSLDNVLRAMNLVSGGLQWMRSLPVRPAWGPVRAGSSIIVAGQNAPLRAFNIKDGTPAVAPLIGVGQQPQGVLDAAAALAKEPEYDDDGEPIKPTPLTLVTLATDIGVAAAPYALEHPMSHQPMALLLFKDIASGVSATLVVHSVEPVMIPAVAQLPNLVQIAPVTPTTPPPRP
jgi:outer membrane protein assembly factor BamB